MSSEPTAIQDHMERLAARLRSTTADCRDIQQELSRAAIQAAAEPRILDALKSMEKAQLFADLKDAADQMRQFLWFYQRAINPEAVAKIRTDRSERTERLASLLQYPGLFEDDWDDVEADFLDRVTNAADTALHQYLIPGKGQKPN